MEFNVLYTHQKTKKAKTWQDGVLKIILAQNRALLYDQKYSKLDAVFVRPNQVLPGEEIESDRYLIQIEDARTSGGSPQTVSARSYEAENRSLQLGVRSGNLPPTSNLQATCDQISSSQTSVGSFHQQVPRVGLKRKKTGFVPPRQVKPRVSEPEDVTPSRDVPSDNRTSASPGSLFSLYSSVRRRTDDETRTPGTSPLLGGHVSPWSMVGQAPLRTTAIRLAASPVPDAPSELQMTKSASACDTGLDEQVDADRSARTSTRSSWNKYLEESQPEQEDGQDIHTSENVPVLENSLNAVQHRRKDVSNVPLPTSKRSTNDILALISLKNLASSAVNDSSRNCSPVSPKIVPALVEVDNPPERTYIMDEKRTDIVHGFDDELNEKWDNNDNTDHLPPAGNEYTGSTDVSASKMTKGNMTTLSLETPNFDVNFSPLSYASGSDSEMYEPKPSCENFREADPITDLKTDEDCGEHSTPITASQKDCHEVIEQGSASEASNHGQSISIENPNINQFCSTDSPASYHPTENNSATIDEEIVPQLSQEELTVETGQVQDCYQELEPVVGLEGLTFSPDDDKLFMDSEKSQSQSLEISQILLAKPPKTHKSFIVPEKVNSEGTPDLPIIPQGPSTECEESALGEIIPNSGDSSSISSLVPDHIKSDKVHCVTDQNDTQDSKCSTILSVASMPSKVPDVLDGSLSCVTSVQTKEPQTTSHAVTELKMPDEDVTLPAVNKISLLRASSLCSKPSGANINHGFNLTKKQTLLKTLSMDTFPGSMQLEEIKIHNPGDAASNLNSKMARRDRRHRALDLKLQQHSMHDDNTDRNEEPVPPKTEYSDLPHPSELMGRSSRKREKDVLPPTVDTVASAKERLQVYQLRGAQSSAAASRLNTSIGSETTHASRNNSFHERNHPDVQNASADDDFVMNPQLVDAVDSVPFINWSEIVFDRDSSGNALAPATPELPSPGLDACSMMDMSYMENRDPACIKKLSMQTSLDKGSKFPVSPDISKIKSFSPHVQEVPHIFEPESPIQICTNTDDITGERTSSLGEQVPEAFVNRNYRNISNQSSVVHRLAPVKRERKPMTSQPFVDLESRDHGRSSSSLNDNSTAIGQDDNGMHSFVQDKHESQVPLSPITPQHSSKQPGWMVGNSSFNESPFVPTYKYEDTRGNSSARLGFRNLETVARQQAPLTINESCDLSESFLSLDHVDTSMTAYKPPTKHMSQLDESQSLSTRTVDGHVQADGSKWNRFTVLDIEDSTEKHFTSNSKGQHQNRVPRNGVDHLVPVCDTTQTELELGSSFSPDSEDQDADLSSLASVSGQVSFQRDKPTPRTETLGSHPSSAITSTVTDSQNNCYDETVTSNLQTKYSSGIGQETSSLSKKFVPPRFINSPVDPVLMQSRLNRQSQNGQTPKSVERFVSQKITGSELKFPSEVEAEVSVNILRQSIIPVSFASLDLYKKALSATLKEYLNVQLLELSKSYHNALSKVDISGYEVDNSRSHQRTTTNRQTSSKNPACEHNIPSKIVQVRKAGPNKGRYFFACPQSRDKQCKFFKWADESASSGRSNVGSCGGGAKLLQLSDAESIRTYFKGQGVALYCECQIIRKTADHFMTRNKNVPPWVKKKFYGEEYGTEKKKLFIKLSRREPSAYSKDDLWIVSKSLNFEPSSTFLAKSAFFGPTSSGEVELDPLSGYSPSNWQNGVCHAIHAGNASNELVCLTNIEEFVNPMSMPLLPTLLNKDTSKPSRMFCQKTAQSIFHTPGDVLVDLADQFIDKYQLNSDQALALKRMAAMLDEQTEISPSSVALIHGVFGAGKSYLLAVMILFLVEVFEHSDSHTPGVPLQHKILISSITNVAVDRILLGLLELGFDDFIRVGSVKKIAKPILPYSVHATGSDSQEMKDLQDMLKSDITPSEKLHVRKSMEKLRKGDNKKKLNLVRVVGATCAACPFQCLKDFKFTMVMLDECSQMTEPASLLPIARFCARKLVIVGDPKQLDPTLQGPDAAHNNGLEQTMFDRLVKMGHEMTMLRTQYRCHPRISAMASELFYENKLLDGVQSSNREPLMPGLPTLCFVDVQRGVESTEGGGSFYNEQEARVVVQVVRALSEHGIPPADVGVITLYKAQQRRIIQCLAESSVSDSDEMKSIQVSTVDAFQGAERGIIILSCVRTRSVGFIDCSKRSNVALTRAKNHLLIVGHKKNLSRNQLWSKVIQICQSCDEGLQNSEQFIQNHCQSHDKENIEDPQNEMLTEKRKRHKPLVPDDADFESSPNMSLDDIHRIDISTPTTVSSSGHIGGSPGDSPQGMVLQSPGLDGKLPLSENDGAYMIHPKQSQILGPEAFEEEIFCGLDYNGDTNSDEDLPEGLN